MNELLIIKKVENHKVQVENLSKIEAELVEMISNTGNEKLMEKFIDWQNQRTRCNETYIATISKLVES
jgi:hypothetical protein